MPMYDRLCQSCGLLREDLLEPISRSGPIPCGCGGVLVRSIATGRFHKASGVAPDLIPGGIEIKHGICWPDGTPRRYDSRSEMKRVARDLGVENMVRHVTPPDSDKAKHTTRWVSAPVISEEERKRLWWEHERENGFAPPKPAEEVGVGLVVESRPDVSRHIADAILKIESSGFNEAEYRGVNNPYTR